jgi:hypothetical protein
MSSNHSVWPLGFWTSKPSAKVNMPRSATILRGEGMGTTTNVQAGLSAMFARPAEYTEVPVLSLPKPTSFSVETTLERA